MLDSSAGVFCYGTHSILAMGIEAELSIVKILRLFALFHGRQFEVEKLEAATMF